jgi:hypothetical protein
MKYIIINFLIISLCFPIAIFAQEKKQPKIYYDTDLEKYKSPDSEETYKYNQQTFQEQRQTEEIQGTIENYNKIKQQELDEQKNKNERISAILKRIKQIEEEIVECDEGIKFWGYTSLPAQSRKEEKRKLLSEKKSLLLELDSLGVRSASKLLEAETQKKTETLRDRVICRNKMIYFKGEPTWCQECCKGTNCWGNCY